MGQLYRFEGEYRYMSRDSYNVYNIDKNGKVTLVYKMNVGKYQMPVGAIYDAANYRELVDRYVTIWSIFETNDYLLSILEVLAPKNIPVMPYLINRKEK